MVGVLECISQRPFAPPSFLERGWGGEGRTKTWAVAKGVRRAGRFWLNDYCSRLLSVDESSLVTAQDIGRPSPRGRGDKDPILLDPESGVAQ